MFSMRCSGFWRKTVMIRVQTLLQTCRACGNAPVLIQALKSSFTRKLDLSPAVWIPVGIEAPLAVLLVLQE